MQTAGLSTRPQSAGRASAGHVLPVIFAWVGLVLAVPVGILAGALVFFVVANLTPEAPLLVGAPLLAQAAVTVGLAWPAARRISPRWRKQIAVAVGLGATLCAAVVVWLLLFRPLATSAAALAPPQGAAYWDLPTGSRIAYLKVPAAAPDGKISTTPVIRVHGGPGAYAVSNQRFLPLYKEIAAEGFDVYAYDQVGSGLSERLANPAEYTLDRHIADLDAIRAQIGAEKVALLADSWGAALASGYMTVHPDRVAKVVFTSPAPMDFSEWRDQKWGDITASLPAERKKEIDAMQSQPRFMALVLLSRVNARAAYNLSSDAELDAFFDQWTGKMLPGMLCDPASYPPEDLPHGFGFWANVMSGSDASLHSKGQRAALASNHTPALILKGECDYIKMEVAQQYKDTLPNSTLLYIPRAGHTIYYDQPALFTQAVKAFLQE